MHEPRAFVRLQPVESAPSARFEFRGDNFLGASASAAFMPLPLQSPPNYYRDSDNLPSMIGDHTPHPWDPFRDVIPNVVDLSNNVDVVINLSSEDDDIEHVQPMNLSRKRLHRDASTVIHLRTVDNCDKLLMRLTSYLGYSGSS